MAADHTRRIVVVSFRGSSSGANWEFNFKQKQVPTGLCNGCDGHEGFFRSWTVVRERVFELLRTAAQSYPGYTVILTGHSLGAAVAAFGFMDLLNSGLTTLLVRWFRQPPFSAAITSGHVNETNGNGVQYMYGAPKIGNRPLLEHLNSQRRAFHVAHKADPFPQLPFGEKYAFALPMFSLGGGERATAADISVLPSVQNIFEVIAQNPWNPMAHMGYFSGIASCK